MNKDHVLKLVFSNPVILVVSLSVGIIVSYSLGFGLGVDDLNYHLYNPHAFLSGRQFSDIPASAMHNYLNPIMDILYLFLIKNFYNMLYVLAIVDGLFYGFIIFLVYKISEMFIVDESLFGKILVMCATFIGVSGVAVICQIRFLSKEVHIGLFFLLGLYLLLKAVYFNDKKLSLAMTLLSGIFMGAAIGMKLTFSVYGLATGLAVILTAWRLDKPIKTILLLFAGSLIGFFLINGYFFVAYYKHFGNPFFPYFNAIFKSPYADLSNLRDMRFMPQTLLDQVFFPFKWAKGNQAVAGELNFHDLRWSLIYVLSVFSLLLFLVKLIFKKTKFYVSHLTNAKLFLYFYTLTAYVVWQNLFSIIRYTVLIEVFSGILIVLLVNTLLPHFKFRHVTLCVMIIIIAIIIQMEQTYPVYHRVVKKSELVDIDYIHIPDNKILQMTGNIDSYLLPFIDTKARMIASNDLTDRYFFAADILNKNSENVFVLIQNSQLEEGDFLQYIANKKCIPLFRGMLYNHSLCVPPGYEYVVDSSKNVLPNLDITTSGDVISNADESKLFYIGWMPSNISQRWSFSTRPKIIFRIENNSKFEGILTLNASIVDSSLTIYLNGTKIYYLSKDAYHGNQEIHFDKSLLKKGNNELLFYIPESLDENKKLTVKMSFNELSIR